VVRRAALAAGRFFFATRNVLFVAVFLAVVFASTPRPFLGSVAADAWLDALGILIVAAGQGVRALVIGLAFGDIRRGGKHLKIHADALVQEGLFAHCRNPLYVGNVLIYFGLFVILNSPAGWLIGVPFFVSAYWLITLAEENFLRKRFGAVYEDYCRRVPRFVPALRGFAQTVRSVRFDVKRVIRKEYGQAHAWFTAALVVIVREHWAWTPRDARGPLIRNALLAWTVLFVAYGVTRYFKKSGRLVDA
jgi:protein-S-isoprenylcysteine O-methyltransferase Ste14